MACDVGTFQFKLKKGSLTLVIKFPDLESFVRLRGFSTTCVTVLCF